MKSVRILSEPTEAMPIPVSKWKMNVSLETNLDLRPISLRNIRERAKFRIQEGIVRGFRDFLTTQALRKSILPNRCQGAEAEQYFQAGLFSPSGNSGTKPTVL